MGPAWREIEASILAFSALGLRVHFTELDVDVLPQVWNLPVAEISTRFEYKPERDPFKAGLTQEMSDKLSSRYEELFKLFIKHKDKIDRVTLWGVSDDASWLNDFPIRGRTAYPRCLTAATSPRTRTAGCWRCRAAGSASGRRNGHDLGTPRRVVVWGRHREGVPKA